MVEDSEGGKKLSVEVGPFTSNLGLMYVGFSMRRSMTEGCEV